MQQGFHLRKSGFIQKVFILLIVMTIPVSYLSPFISVSAKVISAEKVIDNIILKDLDGNIIDEGTNPGNPVSLDEAVGIYYQWSIKTNGDVSPGDHVYIQIPKEFKIYNEISGQLPATVNGHSAGNFTVNKAGVMKIIFNEYVENNSGIGGEIQLVTRFDKEIILTSDTKVIVFDINEQFKKEIEIKFTPENTTKNITKEYKASKYNPNKLNWEIKVNKRLDKLNQVSVHDEIGEGHTLITDSVEVVKLKVHLDGTDETTEEKLSEENYTLTYNEDHSKFTLSFEHSIDQAYVIKYSTRITNPQQSLFKNTAIHSVENILYDPQEVSCAINMGNLLEKRTVSFDANTGIAKWVVKVNYRETELDEVELKDILSSGHELVDGSVQIKEVTINSNTQASTGPVLSADFYNINKSDNGFTIQFKESINKAYEVTYETRVTDASVKQLKNQAVLSANGETISSSESSVSTAVPTDQFGLVYKATNGSFNYQSRLQSWKVTVNRANAHLEAGTVVTDTFPYGGMEFLPETIRITDHSGHRINDDEYTLQPIDGDEKWLEGFRVTFHNDLTSAYHIEYQTKVRPELHTNPSLNTHYRNKALVETVINGQSYQNDVYWSARYNDRIANNGEKKGNYNYGDHSISWDVLFNDNQQLIENPVLKDIIPETLEVIRESIEIFTVTMGSNGTYTKKDKVDPHSYELTTDGQKLIVQFKEGISERYLLTYKTKIKGITQREYNNTIEVYDGEQLLNIFNGSVAVPTANQYIYKTGKQNDQNVNWEIYINKSLSTIQNAVVKDEPSLGQKLLEDTINIYKVDIDENGTYTPEETAIGKALYTVERIYDLETGAESFRINFKEEIDSAYLIKYSTKISVVPENGSMKLSNNAVFSGEGINLESSTTKTEIIVYTTIGSGIGTGEFGSIKIEKADSVTKKPLANAEFTLYRNDVPIRKINTDENGMAVFDQLLYGEYKVVETNAPEGYILTVDQKEVTINAKQKNHKYIIENDPKGENAEGNPDNPEGEGDTGNTEKPGTGEDDSDATEKPEEGETGDTEKPGTEEDDSDATEKPEEGETGNTEKPGTGEDNSDVTEKPEEEETGDTEKPGTGEDNSDVTEKPEEGETGDSEKPGTGEADNNSIGSNVEQPKDESEDKVPNGSEGGSDSENSVLNDSEGGSDNKNDGKENVIQILPQTGEEHLRLLKLIGLICIIFSVILIRYHENKQKN